MPTPRVVWYQSTAYSTAPITFTVPAGATALSAPLFIVGIADGSATNAGVGASFSDGTTTYNSTDLTWTALLGQPYGAFFSGTVRAPTASAGGTFTVSIVDKGSGGGTGGGVLCAILVDADTCEFKLSAGFSQSGVTLTAPTLSALSGADPDAQQPVGAAIIVALAGASARISNIPPGWTQIAGYLTGGAPQGQVLYAYAADSAADTTVGTWTLDNAGRAYVSFGYWIIPREPVAPTTVPHATRPFAPTMRVTEPCQPVLDNSVQLGGHGSSLTVPFAIPSGVTADTAVIASVNYFRDASLGTTSSVTYGGTSLTLLGQRASPNVTMSGVVGAIVTEWWGLHSGGLAASGNLVATFTAATKMLVTVSALQNVVTFGAVADNAGVGSSSYAMPSSTLTGGCVLAIASGSLTLAPSPIGSIDDIVLGTIWHALGSQFSASDYYYAGTSGFPRVCQLTSWVGLPAGPAPRTPYGISGSSTPWTFLSLPVYGKSASYTSSWRLWGGVGRTFGGSKAFLADQGVLPNDNYANYNLVAPAPGTWDDVVLDESDNGMNALGLLHGSVYTWGADQTGIRGLGVADIGAVAEDGVTYIGPTGGATYPPVLVPGLPSNIVKIALDSVDGIALALDANKNLWAWGNVGDLTRRGQLGTIFPTSVVCVAPFITLTDVEDMDVSIALKSDGSVWTCGPNDGTHGVLGIGGVVDNSPHAWTRVTGFTGTPAKVRSGRTSSRKAWCIIMANRDVWAWAIRGDCVGINTTSAVLRPTDLCLQADDVLLQAQVGGVPLLVLLKDGVVYRSKAPTLQLVGFRSLSGMPPIAAIAGNAKTDLLCQDTQGAVWVLGDDRYGACALNGYEHYDESGQDVSPSTTGLITTPVVIGGTYALPTTVRPVGFNYAWQQGKIKSNPYVTFAKVTSTDYANVAGCPSGGRSFAWLIG